MSESILKIEHLYHRYSQQWAVEDINLEIGKRGVWGLLGSNGAGKSTTMNIICGVLSPTRGKVFINGVDLAENPIEAKKYIGFLPQTPPLYTDQNVDEYLGFCARLRGIAKKDVHDAVERVKEKCGIAHFSKRVLFRGDTNREWGLLKRLSINRHWWCWMNRLMDWTRIKLLKFDI